MTRAFWRTDVVSMIKAGAWVRGAVLALCMSLIGSGLAAAQTMEVAFIDVEGGQATLIVSPSGQSMLVDTGWPGANGRDADRIAAAAKRAGVTAIDYLVLTHYHDDHVGGIEQLAARLPFRNIITHGPNGETGRIANIVNPIVERVMNSTTAKRKVAAPGDVIPITGIDVKVISSNRQLIAEPVVGASRQPNDKCAAAVKQREDRSENSASVALLITFGKFRFLDLGDVTQDLEFDLACPVNRIGEVDLYLTSHHGSAASGAEVLVHALKPRVAVMNNGARKGGDAAALDIVRRSPGLEDLWMLHYAVAAGRDMNVAEPFIANTEESADPLVNDHGFGIRVSAREDGSFTLTNERTQLTKTYARR